MPANLRLTAAQLRTIIDNIEEEDVIVLELPNGVDALDVWVLDEESLSTRTHRSLLLDEEGNILSDERESDA